jgi:hypothetical protein
VEKRTTPPAMESPVINLDELALLDQPSQDLKENANLVVKSARLIPDGIELLFHSARYRISLPANQGSFSNARQGAKITTGNAKALAHSEPLHLVASARRKFLASSRQTRHSLRCALTHSGVPRFTATSGASNYALLSALCDHTSVNHLVPQIRGTPPPVAIGDVLKFAIGTLVLNVPIP